MWVITRAWHRYCADQPRSRRTTSTRTINTPISSKRTSRSPHCRRRPQQRRSNRRRCPAPRVSPRFQEAATDTSTMQVLPELRRHSMGSGCRIIRRPAAIRSRLRRSRRHPRSANISSSSSSINRPRRRRRRRAPSTWRRSRRPSHIALLSKSTLRRRLWPRRRRRQPYTIPRRPYRRFRHRMRPRPLLLKVIPLRINHTNIRWQPSQRVARHRHRYLITHISIPWISRRRDLHCRQSRRFKHPRRRRITTHLRAQTSMLLESCVLVCSILCANALASQL